MSFIYIFELSTRMTSAQCQLFLLLTAAFSLSTVIETAGQSHTIIGDVVIYSNATYFRCDKIVCPVEANRCQVIKQKNANNATLIRQNICLGPDDKILLKETFTENIDSRGKIEQKLNAYRNGFTSSFQSSDSMNANQIASGNMEKEFQLHLGNAERMTKEIGENLKTMNAKIERNIQDTLNMMFRGSH